MVLTAGAADKLWVLVLAQALHAFTFATHHTVCIALLSQHFPGAMRGRGQALYTVIGYGMPGLLGGVTGGWLSSVLGLASVFWASVLSSALAWALAWQSWRLAASGLGDEPQGAAGVGGDLGL
jgi:PPP family 3-phenylpropionic acid transporter